MGKSVSTCVQMISYDGSDFTTASMSKKSSPVVQSTGKVIKSIFVPNVGWASQLTSGEVWVQFNDGSQLVVQAGVSSITYTSPEGRITTYVIVFHRPPPPSQER